MNHDPLYRSSRFLRILLVCFYAVAGFTFQVKAQVLEFTENKGQWHPEVQYMGRLSSGALFLSSTGYTVLQYHPGDYTRVLNSAAGHGFLNSPVDSFHIQSAEGVSVPEQNIRSHAYRVHFKGSNPVANPVPEKPQPGYSNFFLGNDTTRWATGVQGYALVGYPQLYRGVQARYYSEDGFVKYDLVVQPMGALAEIALEYQGVESLSVVANELVIKTSVGEIREKAPYAYQVINGVRQQVSCNYWVQGNLVRFRVKNYQPEYLLVIDPTFVFSTFVGSVADNWGYTATFDSEGNAYGGGIVMGTGYPTTTGAFQTGFAGGVSSSEGTNGFDISIIKLDPLGRTRLYSTYLGGSSNEQPHSLITDASGNLIVAGRTLSNNYPVRGAGAIGAGGQWDIVVTKFNATGSALIGSVRIGGTADDGANVRHKLPGPSAEFTNQNYGDDARSEVIIDNGGNIYLASCTRSSDFPVTPNNVQGSLRGAQDAMLLRFNATLTTLDFATYLGGTNYDAAYVLVYEPTGHILVGGGTMSSDFPGVKAGTVGPNFEGGLLDGFVARLSVTGSALSEVAFIGTQGNEQVYGVQKDKNGFIYVMGTGTGNFPVRNAGFSQPGGKQFIAKLQHNLSAYVYSTVFGTNNPFPNISPTAFLVDNCENVYVSGWGGNIITGSNYPITTTTGLTVTPDAIKSVTDGRDFYFFVLEKDAVAQLYGSFFGLQDASNPGSHDHVDGGTSRFDENGIIYQGICAACNGGQFPTTPGTVSPGNPSSRCNLAIVKINFNLSGVRTGIQSFIDGIRRDSSFCVPATIEFVDSVAIGRRFEWSFGDGSLGVTNDSPHAVHTYAQPGVYRVRLIAIDDTKCIPRDTAYMNIRVRIDRVPLLAEAVSLPPCRDYNFRFNNRSTPFPGKPFRDNSFIWLFGDNSAPVQAGLTSVTHRFPGPGTYQVRMVLADTNYCNAPDTFTLQIRVNENVAARLDAPLFGCAPFLASFINTSLGGTSFSWDFGNGQTSTAINPQVLYPNPGVYRVKMVANDPSTCNLTDSTFFNITVSGSPSASFTYSPLPSRENIPTTFSNLSGPAVFYRWEFGDGGTLLTLRRDTLVKHQYPSTANYNACVIAVNEYGCADTACTVVPASVNPLVEVVTAFTPNNDGNNDRAVVYAFAVERLLYRIFNRWGQLMFETTNAEIGWDGKFKGVPQPMDAYAYTLEAELLDGTRVKRSGSITLIR